MNPAKKPSELQEANKSKARKQVEQMLERGLNSGESKEWTRQDAEELKDEIRARARCREGSTS